MADSAPLTDEDICVHVRDSVLEQRLAPGTKLTEEALCSIFGVGRTTVRRAFLLLKRDNIIELHKNRGAVVASPNPEEARQVFESRRMVEKALLENAAGSFEAAATDRLHAHLADEQKALANGNIAHWIRLTGEFHLQLARLSGNRLMSAFLEQLVFQTSLIVALYRPAGSAANCSGSDHLEIVEALEANDTSRAIDLLVAHLHHIEAELVFEPAPENKTLLAAFGPVKPASQIKPTNRAKSA